MSAPSTAATPRQKTTVVVLSVVLVTVLWFQLVWRGHHEDAAGAVVEDPAALVTDDPAATDPTATDPTGTDPTVTDPATDPGAPTTTAPLAALPIDHVAALRLVQEAAIAGGVSLTAYVPTASDEAQVQLDAGYAGLVVFLGELRTQAPAAAVTSLSVEPRSASLAVTLTVRWAAS